VSRHRSSIGGQLDYARLAELHKPTDPSAQIRRMHNEGLKPRDIASVLAIHIDVVLRALRQVSP
jgi:hypothetical protein